MRGSVTRGNVRVIDDVQIHDLIEIEDEDEGAMGPLRGLIPTPVEWGQHLEELERLGLQFLAWKWNYVYAPFCEEIKTGMSTYPSEEAGKAERMDCGDVE